MTKAINVTADADELRRQIDETVTEALSSGDPVKAVAIQILQENFNKRELYVNPGADALSIIGLLHLATLDVMLDHSRRDIVKNNADSPEAIH